MQVSSRITINTTAVNQLCDLAKQALVQTAEALHTEVVQAEVMPRDTGCLQNESTFVYTSQIDMGKVSLVSSTPYARRLYFHPEYNFHRGEWFDKAGKSHGGNSNAGGLWLKPWIDGEHKDFCPETFKRLYKRLLRGA
jgi:hypothetical protein